MWHFAVIGDPIKHSLSPQLHTYLMEKSGISGDYGRIHVQSEDDLHAVIQQISCEELDGINITSPWKSKAVEYIDEMTDEAAAAGVVNTIAKSGNGLIGHNTDILGFSQALQRNFEISKSGKPAVLGAGGSARAVLLGLQRLGYEECVILNRTIRNAEILIKSIDIVMEIEINKLLESNLNNALYNNDLVVNTIPEYGRGIFADAVFSPQNTGAYFDLLYANTQLELVQNAQNAGWNVCDGLDMLIYQGMAALEYWTEQKVADKIEMAAIRKYLRKEDSIDG